jgi:chloramphenicol-sensitive protein RarD
MKAGILYAIAAYALWGLFPIYWKSMQTVPATEILCHRMVWSLVVMVVILGIKKRWLWLRRAVTDPATLITFLGTASLLAVNWFTYVWAVNSGHLIEASLGYFINPLFTVLLGVLFLRERPRFWQWSAIVVATCGILFLTMKYGAFPWIALVLASTFGIFSLLRKTTSLDTIEGLSLETMILFIPAVAYLLYLEHADMASFVHAGTATTILLSLAGLVTLLPLLFFVTAARKITLTNLGMLQYIAPTFQFLLGVFVYGEPFTRTRLIGFIIIWIALLIYSVESFLVGSKKRTASVELEGIPREIA